MLKKINLRRILKFLRNLVIGSLILLALLIGAGFAYTWYVGQQDINESPDSSELVETAKPKIAEPTKPAANAKVGAAVQMLTSPIKPGTNASVIVKTNAGSKCTISVLYNEVTSKDSGLTPKIADDYGVVSWTWTVESSVPIGKWPVNVTCVYNGRSAFVRGDLVVVKQI